MEQPQQQPKGTLPKQGRVSPRNELDFNLMTTDAVWGKADVPLELKRRLNKYYLARNEKGQETQVIESLWGLLGFYTRDMRLANLSNWNGEIQYCQYMLDLANDLLQTNLIEPFLITLSRVATVLELSQSKGGFLRRRMHTFTQESKYQEQEPPKKSLFGGAKKKEGF